MYKTNQRVGEVIYLFTGAGFLPLSTVFHFVHLDLFLAFFLINAPHSAFFGRAMSGLNSLRSMDDEPKLTPERLNDYVSMDLP